MWPHIVIRMAIIAMYMAIYAYIYIYIHIYIYIYVAIYGHIWTYMIIYGHIWPCLWPYIWTYPAMYDYTYGHIRSYMVRMMGKQLVNFVIIVLDLQSLMGHTYMVMHCRAWSIMFITPASDYNIFSTGQY